MKPRSRAITIGVIFCVILLLVEYQQLQENFFPESTSDNVAKSPSSLVDDISKEDFITAAIVSAVEDDFDDIHIRRMCDAAPWDRTVVFTCRGIIGGIGNIRQELLHCIRYAIDAGAGLVMPTINLRSEDNLSDLKNGTVPMSYLFDESRFVQRLKKACAQMPIYDDLEELQTAMSGLMRETEAIELRQLPHWPFSLAYSALSRVQQLKTPTEELNLIPFEHVWQYFPICHDSLGFANTFGNLIPFRQDVYRLAALILYNLYNSSGLDIDPTVTTTRPRSYTFLGIHIRTANDVLPQWLNYTDQARYYLSRIESSSFLSSLSSIYIASGNSTSIEKFRAESDNFLSRPKAVVTKHDLLSGSDLEKLTSLTWDQQAVVDLLVLSRASYFMGMADSTFAWTIALDRRITSKDGSCGHRKSWWKSRVWGAAFRDDFSDLMGNHAYGWEDRMWP